MQKYEEILLGVMIVSLITGFVVLMINVPTSSYPEQPEFTNEQMFQLTMKAMECK